MLGIPKAAGWLILREAAPKVIEKVTAKVAPKVSKKKEPEMDLTVLGVARHILQLAAGALLARGYIDASGVDLVIGAGVSAVTLGWYLVKRFAARKA